MPKVGSDTSRLKKLLSSLLMMGARLSSGIGEDSFDEITERVCQL
jgi:hypothetical protein